MMNDLFMGIISAFIEILRSHTRLRLLVTVSCAVLVMLAIILRTMSSTLFAPQIAESLKQVWPVLLATFGAGFLLSVASYSPIRFRSGSFEFYREKIAEAESKFQAEPEKVRPAWDLARVTLEAYFNRNLSQITAIFWLSVVVMVVGFGIIIWGIAQALQSQDSVVPAAIASVAGVITEFIGATFLFVYRSTIQQGMDYSKTLERINAVGMAMQILDTMPDETKPDDLKSKTKATLVELLVRQAHEISNKGEETGGESNKTKTA
jgi:hypothetical protein